MNWAAGASGKGEEEQELLESRWLLTLHNQEKR